MKVTTIEVSTDELFALAKQGARNGFSFYQFLLEKYSQVKRVFDAIANSNADFSQFEVYCDLIMTREDAIQFLVDAGHFRV